jgi:two-component sensor histidine kinase
MKRGILIRKILYSPWLLALLPAIVISLFLPPLGLHYKLLIEDNGKLRSSAVYADLNSDTITELISSGKGIPYYYVLVSDNKFRVYDQWNLKDDFSPSISELFFGNIDNDLYREIYIFSHNGDSLFLNVNEFFDTSGIKIEREYITKIGFVNSSVTSSVYPVGFFDVNGDGYSELYFSIVTGFGLIPRLLYYYDFKNKVLKNSQLVGLMCHFPYFLDSDADNKPEIFGMMNSSANYSTPVPYSDRSSWFMVFDEQLNFEFPPVEFPGFANNLIINSYTHNNFRGYLLSHNTTSADTSVLKPRIMLYSLDGKKKKERPYTDFGFNGTTLMGVMSHKNSDRIYLMQKDLIEINSDLEIINSVKSPFLSLYNLQIVDFDLDGEKDLVLYSDDEEKLVVYDAFLRKIVETKIVAKGGQLRFSQSISQDHTRKLHMTSAENSYLLEVVKNEYYYFGFLIYPGIYILLVLFISGINRINTHNIQQKENLKQRLLTFQLQGIKSQLDPHFTFNTLNSIASLIYLEDRQTAYDYMNKFTMLLRTMLNDTERVYRSLGEEIEFVTTYLDLEKLRFGEKFDYKIEISDEVSQKEQVPKLVLQTFAENAIKHGLMTYSYGGILRITVLREGDYLKLSIEDNGIGREKSSGRSTSTGKGLKLTSDFFEILNQMNNRAIRNSITDLQNENGDPAGTRVDVWVPVEPSKK